MRFPHYLASLAAVTPSLVGVQSFAPPLQSPSWATRIRSSPHLSSIRFLSAKNPTTSNSDNSDATVPIEIVHNDTTGTSSLPLRNLTDVDDFIVKGGDSSNHNVTVVVEDPNKSGDQLASSATTTAAPVTTVPPLPETLDASGLLSLDPAVVDIVEIPPAPVSKSNGTNGGDSTLNLEKMLQGLPFVSMFRGSANYIANHRNTLAVYHIPGGLLDLPDPTVFRDLMNDIALTWLLGMKIVLVAGCRHQIEKRIPHEERQRYFGIPVTDPETLRVVKEEAGYVRFEIERQLARSLRMQGGYGEQQLDVG